MHSRLRIAVLASALMALTAACGGAEPVEASSQGAGGQAGGGPGGRGDPGAGPPVIEESAGSYEADSAWIFSDKTVHTIEIKLPDASVASLTAEPYEWAPGEVTFDGEVVPQTGVRLRGKIGSFRTLSQKPKFKLKFNELVEDQRFHGLEALGLNNSVVDCSYLKEPLGYRVFALAGVPAERVGFAQVFVNGSDYGLYVLVEVPDDRFLKRVYKNPDGNLYDGKYIWYGDFNYQLLDFNSGVDDLYSLEEGTDVGNKDITAVSQAVAASVGTGQLVAGLDPVLDWDEFHRLLAVEQWIGHNDGYAMNRNNYRVYFDPDDGKAEFIPWDLDLSYLYDYQWGFSWSSPAGQIASGCFNDAACVEAHKEAMKALISAVDPAELTAYFDAIDALTLDYATSDPRKECGAGEVAPWRQALRDWIGVQNAQMSAYWGL
jgi:spore coat protein CotH